MFDLKNSVLKTPTTGAFFRQRVQASRELNAEAHPELVLDTGQLRLPVHERVVLRGLADLVLNALGQDVLVLERALHPVLQRVHTHLVPAVARQHLPLLSEEGVVPCHDGVNLSPLRRPLADCLDGVLRVADQRTQVFHLGHECPKRTGLAHGGRGGEQGLHLARRGTLGATRVRRLHYPTCLNLKIPFLFVKSKTDLVFLSSIFINKMPRIGLRETTWRIRDIVDNYRPDGSGDFSIPPSQRGWAWKSTRGKNKQIRLIDSAMNNIPIPTCIVNQVNYRKYDIYDGRHRFETFYDYANDGFEWNGKRYSQLSEEEKRIFNERLIPITIVNNITIEELCDMFIRLNSGSPLKDYDLFWANKNKPLIQAVQRLILNNARLAACFGMTVDDLNHREDLSNWVSLLCGLATKKSTNISTSFIRVSDSREINLDTEVDDETVNEGLNAVCRLYETANTRFPATGRELKTLKKIPKITAFFLEDWFTIGEDAHDKWVDIIGRLRNAGTKVKMSAALSTTGAQNLTATKVSTVMRQVNYYLETGQLLTPGNAVDDDDDVQ